MKIRYTMIGILAIMALFLLAGCQQKQENTINVEGNAEIIAKPDQAEVWLGISIVKDTAAEAQNEANKIVNDILDGLRSKGIQEQDIQTEQLSLYEERTWTQDGGSKLVGWRASQTLKVKTTDLSKVGTIVDIGVSNGANQVNNINFGLSLEKEQEYKQKALSEATKNAKSKADTIAQSLGVKLGKIKSVSESSFDYMPYAYTMEAKATRADMVEEAASVMPRDVTVNARISLVYNIG